MKTKWIQTDLPNYYESSLVMFATLMGSKSHFFVFSNQTLRSVEFQQQHLEPFPTSAVQTDECWISNGWLDTLWADSLATEKLLRG